MPTTSAILTGLAGVLAVLGLAVYLFGIPPEMKRKMEKAALKTMGENKASYAMKDQISKIPASDQKDVQDVKNTIGNVGGGAMQNPIGEEGGELADKLTSPLTGR
ncbi:hypothetical protein EG328_001421 [Venturia inaequalis]|nr:hypothetical protein EG327_008786 [Venturia inaequalis]KAE9978511.1 hypothetical protein EG328_001421 [Venturia inaequalis]RDI89368.1 hypothetical protein Vi05172_g327 [Venturia inaequalis]